MYTHYRYKEDKGQANLKVDDNFYFPTNIFQNDYQWLALKFA